MITVVEQFKSNPASIVHVCAKSETINVCVSKMSDLISAQH
jgi:hypothetical protein